MKKYIISLMLLLASCARADYVTEKDLAGANKPAAACSYILKNINQCLTLNWITQPTSDNFSEFILAFENNENIFDDVQVLLWMPSMGHGSSPVTLTPISATEFRVSKVYFVMPGEWEIRIKIKKTGSVIDQLAIPLVIQ